MSCARILDLAAELVDQVCISQAFRQLRSDMGRAVLHSRAEDCCPEESAEMQDVGVPTSVESGTSNTLTGLTAASDKNLRVCSIFPLALITPSNGKCIKSLYTKVYQARSRVSDVLTPPAASVAAASVRHPALRHEGAKLF
jgi:hypothetical protein